MCHFKKKKSAFDILFYLFIYSPSALGDELKELTRHRRVVPQADSCSDSEEANFDYKVRGNFPCILPQM